jgi:hypothetical protein
MRFAKVAVVQLSHRQNTATTVTTADCLPLLPPQTTPFEFCTMCILRDGTCRLKKRENA